jgi:hypothetical protein
MFSGAYARVADRKKIPDISKPQAKTLRTLDELQPVHGCLVVDPVARRTPGRRQQQARLS